MTCHEHTHSYTHCTPLLVLYRTILWKQRQVLLHLVFSLDLNMMLCILWVHKENTCSSACCCHFSVHYKVRLIWVLASAQAFASLWSRVWKLGKCCQSQSHFPWSQIKNPLYFTCLDYRAGENGSSLIANVRNCFCDSSWPVDINWGVPVWGSTLTCRGTEECREQTTPKKVSSDHGHFQHRKVWLNREH